ncbi:phosphoenolpyruvate--protein phosphotransferase [Tessaracoccus sp. OH4464_COT-324]|uniref:phosphoenolpyruvate--protein phosphotransferase n=1 Tax=Tessaracoccus sp. OH4464_COT-324 TaxID=2491059 RepID=UPI000F62D3FD|nr:phosphoenolpyruvate--protein phosphotransferase [Tessaracoccus sp. OH4464_COT-324]RRD45745.1 phosphoenolpyruvate--protein phosphotransferase [Tessaracoccus sp. OH4464_COT-324]
MTKTLQGIGVSAGLAWGPAARVRPVAGFEEFESPCIDVAAEAERVRAALEEVAGSLRAKAAAFSGQAAEILEMTAQLATDRGLIKAINAQLKSGIGPTCAVHQAIEGYVEKLRSLGGYMAERATDLYDVRNRAISKLRGLPEPGVPELDAPAVVVADDLAPADVATLPSEVLALVLSASGPTSHTAIIAANLGIPTVVRAREAAEIESGQLLAVDGATGKVIVNPNPEERPGFEERARRRSALLSEVRGPGQTSCGRPVALLANIGTVADAKRAAESDVEGVGLFRTEFLFLDRAEPPSVAEQAESYAAVLRAFGSRRVVIRTLDAGADKPLAFANLGKEENPALGVRGLRLSQRRPQLLEDQLAALAQAYREVGGNLHVMAPMVATAAEASWFAERVRAHHLEHVGIMIETPASAVTAGRTLAGLDFASIGTNDLTQYTMAADRLNGELDELLSGWQPAALEMIRLACAGGREAGAHVGVCGESAGDPLLALVLVGLGVSSLSMSLAKVNAVRFALRHHSLAECEGFAQLAVAASSATEARAVVEGNTHSELRDLL